MKLLFAASLALIVSKHSPLENTREIFRGNPPLRAFCGANDTLADDVVDVVREPALSAGRSCAVSPRHPSDSSVPVPHLLGSLARSDIAIARRGDVHYSEAYAEILSWSCYFNVRNFRFLAFRDTGFRFSIPTGLSRLLVVHHLMSEKRGTVTVGIGLLMGAKIFDFQRFRIFELYSFMCKNFDGRHMATAGVGIRKSRL